MINPLSLLQAQARYGAINNGVWGNEDKYCELVNIPDELGANWINTVTQKPVTHIYCNVDLGPKLLVALDLLRVCGVLKELKTFDGCYEIRDVRAIPGKPSCHSYGLAIDINAHENPLGGMSCFSRDFVQCFVKAGFVWGGIFKRPDPMHFSLGW